MSQKKIEKITFKNFKAFRNEETIDFKNKNVLIYGNNGSGKSSIFWALYTFLQSSIKTEANVKKYFKVFNENDPTTFQTLRNIFEEEGEESYIDLTISEGSVKTKRRISLDNIDTIQNADILTLNATSDFINYKLLSSFYNSSHKYDVNLWHVFERDIFPYLVNTVTDQTYLEYIKDKTFDAPRYPSGYVFKQGWQKDQYISQLNIFNQEIQSLLTKIQLTANDFLKEHFFNNEDVLKVELKFDKTFTFDLLEKRIWLEDNKHLRERKLGIKLIVHQFNKTTGNWISLQRVQSLLNEAQLTRIAVSIRIGALRTRIQDTYPKILVLDDMLISLDMANRIEVTKIILNFNNKPTLNFFDSYQKIILTHDKGFYNILKNYTNSNEWEYYNLHKKENSNDAPVLVNEKSHIEKAQRFLAEREFDTCGNELRKELETILKKYLNQGLNKIDDGFVELNKMLKSAYEKYTNNERRNFETIFVNKTIPLETLKKIETDIDADATLSPEEKGKLKSLKSNLYNFLYKQYEVKENKDRLFDDLKTFLDRIMNPSSHSTSETLYEQELEEAIARVLELKEILSDD